MRSTTGAIVLTALLATGCPAHEKEAPHNDPLEPSPNASIMPAPLASGAELSPRTRTADGGHGGIPADSAGRLIITEAGPPTPKTLRPDDVLPRDTLTQRDGVGVTLDAAWRWADVPAPSPAPEVDKDALKSAREKTPLAVTVDLSVAGRMRFEFASAAFPVPPHVALRARSDRYGNILVWPNEQKYRIMQPGTLRALFAERRADVVPLVVGKAKNLGKGNLLGMVTERTQLTTQTGTITLEQARLPGITSSGELLCRLLVELVAVEPSSTVCAPELTPLKAELAWPDHGHVAFEVRTITRRQDLPYGELFVPPVDAELSVDQLPPQTTGVFLTRDDIAKFRTRDVRSTDPPTAGAPGEGLLAVNHTDTLRYVLLDGVPVAWVKPHSQQYIIGPRPGTYVVSWRDFFGAEVDPPKTLALPARVEVGAEPDAGAPER